MVHGKLPVHFLLHNMTTTLNKHLGDNDSVVFQNLTSSTPFPYSTDYLYNSTLSYPLTTSPTVPEWPSNETMT